MMKQLLTIFVFFISTACFGQGTWSKSTANQKPNRVMPDSVLIVPRDTAATNLVIDPSTGISVGDSGRIAYQFAKFWGHVDTGWRKIPFYDDIPKAISATIYDSTWINKRNDQASIVRVANGNLLCVWTAYSTNVEDEASAHIYGAESSDNGLTWHSYRDVVMNFDTTGVYVPSLYRKDNGDLIMMVLTQNSDTTRRIFQLTSTNNGASWSLPEEIYNPVKYLNVAANRLFRASSGRLFYPVQVNQRGGFNSSVGVYEGKVLYSDDEGDNWAVMPYNIQSPDSLVVEAGFYEKNNMLTLYWRSRSGVVYAANSTDNGATFLSPYSTNLTAPNSQTTIVVDPLSGNLIAAHNNLSGSIDGVSSRRALDISFTQDAGRSWTKGYEIVRNSDSTYIEPSLYPLGNSVMVLYSSGSNIEDNYALRTSTIPTDFIYSNSSSNGNTSIRNQDSTFQPASMKIGGTITSGAISSAAHTITATGAIPQFRIVRSEATNQGLAITAGQGNAILHSYEGTGSVFGRFIFRSSRGTDTVEHARIHNNGFLGVGTATPTSTVHSAGSIAAGMTSTAINLTLSTGHHTVRATAVGITITLPAASTAPGRIYRIVNYNTGGNINLTSSGGSILSPLNAAISVIGNGVVMVFQSDGTNWYRVNN